MIKIIAVLVKKHEGILGNLHVLIHEHEEADFWENLVHIQSSRRHKALLRLSRHTGPQLEEQSISVLLPIIRSFILEHRDKNNENIVEAGISCLGLLTSWCSWRRYRAFVRSLIEFLKHTPKRERVCVRILVAIFDSFHFNVGEVHECLGDDDADMSDVEESENEEMDVSDDESESEENEENADDVDPEEIRQTIRKIF